MTDAHDAAVSSVVGTILMLAVTVSVFGGLSIVVLGEIRSAESPPDADLAFLSDGNRAVLVHRGGEPIALSDGFVLLNVNGAELRYDLSAFAAQTGDGQRWQIGETLCLSGPSPPDPARTCLLEDVPILGAAVVAGGGLVADEGERGGDAGPCPLDSAGPTVPAAWTFDPADVLSTTTGDVTVRFTATDDCAGVDDAAPPDLLFRINDGSDPAFTSLGPMTSEGPGVFSGLVTGQSWNLFGGQTLQVYASGLEDTLGNVGADTAVQSEVIDAVTLIRYVTGSTPATALDDAQDDNDLDAAVTFDEVGALGSPGTGGPSKFSGNSQSTGGALNAANVLASDDARAELDTTNDNIEVSGFDLPASADSITALTIGYEGRKASSGGTSPTTRLDYKFSAGTYQTGTSITEANTVDGDRTRSLCTTAATCASGGFTVAAVEGMSVRVYSVAAGTRFAQIDHVFATVTYTTAAQTTYTLDVVLDFAGTSDGASETLELRYKTDGDDTFEVEVWNEDLNAGAGGYTMVGTLASTSFATFTHTLAPGEYNSGSPRIRITDVTTGTTAGAIQVEFARVVTV